MNGYINAEHLIEKIETWTPQPTLGDMSIETTFSDYRDVDGVKVPFTIRYSAIDTYDSWTRKFTEIKRNVVVDDALFKAPATQPE